MIRCPRCNQELEEIFSDARFCTYFRCDGCWMAWHFVQGQIERGRTFRHVEQEARYWNAVRDGEIAERRESDLLQRKAETTSLSFLSRMGDETLRRGRRRQVL